MTEQIDAGQPLPRTGLARDVLSAEDCPAISFADIFRNNCFQNGILTIGLAEASVRDLMVSAAPGSNYRPAIDLETQTITDSTGTSISFEIDEFRRHSLLNGLDDIGLTLHHEDKIVVFEKNRGMPGVS